MPLLAKAARLEFRPNQHQEPWQFCDTRPGPLFLSYRIRLTGVWQSERWREQQCHRRVDPSRRRARAQGPIPQTRIRCSQGAERRLGNPHHKACEGPRGEFPSAHPEGLARCIAVRRLATITLARSCFAPRNPTKGGRSAYSDLPSTGETYYREEVLACCWRALRHSRRIAPAQRRTR
jgi:hypothetical protein